MPKPVVKQSKDLQEDLNGKPLLNDTEYMKCTSKLYDDMNFDKNYNYYHIMGHEEPHLVRRREILAKHPEIKLLYGHDYAGIWASVALVLVQFIAVQYCSKLPWFLYIITAYVIGGTVSHSAQILIHEITHYTCFDTILYNKLLAIFTNLVTGVPVAITFQKYHSDHHTYMNVDMYDPDLPSLWEIRNLNSPFRKFLFIFFQAFFYGLRPLIRNPKIPSKLELFNIAVIFTTDYLIVKYLGWQALGWLILGTFLGIGFHPCAGHTIAEHYEFENRLETYDYIGICNFFNFNVGYHTEHHDFPMIPWTKLSIVRKMAPEFYENLPYHTSYMKVFMLYIFSGYVGPFSRIIRENCKLKTK